MDSDLREDLLKIKSDGYKQLLLKQDQSLIKREEIISYATEIQSIIRKKIERRLFRIRKYYRSRYI